MRDSGNGIGNARAAMTTGRREISNETVVHEWHYTPTEGSNWSKQSQHQISSGWNGIIHFLRVCIGRNKVSIE
jgi:hypothetical protein